ncbi:MAG TPA: STAS domain-containing protein [Dehalococcoidia bacterium]|nr:STAS domain-containing protein [Dehalococcoidia bacterium]
MQQPDEPGSIVLTLNGVLDRSAVASLCDRLDGRLSRADATRFVICDVASLPVDLGSIGALARLRLTALRHGVCLCLRNGGQNLRDLIELAGLSEVLIEETALSVELQGQAEQREQPRGVEEERNAADPGP